MGDDGVIYDDGVKQYQRRTNRPTAYYGDLALLRRDGHGGRVVGGLRVERTEEGGGGRVVVK
jgi:hypothetical protein